MVWNTAGKLPPGTESDEWRKTSARIAWILWLTDRRLKSSTSTHAELTEWNVVAKDYRALVRLVLRSLEREDGIKLRQIEAAAALASTSEQWRKSSARLAWRLWLQIWRTKYLPNPTTELSYWRPEAKEYRAYVRKALKALEIEGIRLVAN